MMAKNFSIIIPVYNEELLLKKQIMKLYRNLRDLKLSAEFEILIVDNGSHDDTGKIAGELARKIRGVRLITIPEPSYGQAFKAGIKSAEYPYLFQFDLDFWNIGFVPKALNLLDKYDLVIGSKNLKGSHDKRPLLRILMSKTVELILKVRFHWRLSDSHGLKAIKKSAITDYIDHIRSPNHFFDSELLLRAIVGGCNFKELPVSLAEIRPSRFPYLVRVKEVLVELLNLIITDIPAKSADGFPAFMKLHADDYGYKNYSDNKIVQMIKRGQLSRFSILANYASTADLKRARKLVNTIAGLKVGLHLNLIEGKSVAGRRAVGSLVDKNNRFYSLPVFTAKLFLGLISRQHLKTEIRQQMQRLKQNGLKIDIFDSHQHLHALSPIAEMVEEVALEEKIKTVRTYKNTRLMSPEAILKYIFLRIAAYLSYLIAYRKIGLPLSWKREGDSSSFLSWEGKSIDTRYLEDQMTTFVIHPGLRFDGNRFYEFVQIKNPIVVDKEFNLKYNIQPVR